MASDGFRIDVDGMKELRAKLRRLDSTAPRALRVAANRAAEIVVNATSPRIPSGPGTGGHVSGNVRARSTQGKARVQAGSRRFPYYGWLEFGGSGPAGRPAEREFIKGGRYLFRAYGEHKPQVRSTLEHELRAAARSAGLRVF